MADLYKRFGYNEAFDYSDKALFDMYSFESTGLPKIDYSLPGPNGKCNGYAVGKHWMDVTVAMWLEDIRKGLLFKFELQEDFPEWFLEKIF